MSLERIAVPIRMVNNERWGWLASLWETHEFCAENVKVKQGRQSFAGNHRVCHFVAKKNVHWKIAAKAIILDISQVQASGVPRRRPGR